MYSISQLQDLINKQIVEKKYPVTPAELYDPITYIMSLGGKRMRPVLTLMACDMFGGHVTKALDPALAIELFHNFTLMHDDIMDKAPLRRGQSTVHSKWNDNVAILSGDVMLVEAYKTLVSSIDSSILRDVLTVFNDTAAGVCEGQQTDMNFELMQDVSIPQYLDMIRLKTAVLLGCSLKIGALIGSASTEDAEHLYNFGVNIGIAFQLQDDILDVYGDPEKFGKQVGGDILSNKKTFLLIKAIELAEDLDKEELQHWLSAADCDPASKISSVTAIYDRLGIRQLAEEQMNLHARKSLYELNKVSVKAENKQVLVDFAGQLLIRET
ncbi:geranylgeranyl diphosphate synthase type II [Arcticibacter pallidicorallinus]|uniref:Geranylgeranyl diphosphate synthase type II n=1 Tax=Arcticibacter pallidicorallinus TaxID=1259464 RepID=A0A2T0TUX4_9SPHI|nr:polyprenyl synthetase family protein [Arcticibacter pallidicorallinus]PRY49502.1 geranylgeranyl diphosphate synthase type II [Arcticibacter pallidicorallinus]